MDELIPQASQAIQERAWYPLAAILISVLIKFLALAKVDLPGFFWERHPKLMWLPAAVLSVFGSFADAYFSGANFQQALGLAAYAALVGTTGAVGTHHVGKDLAQRKPANPSGPMAAGLLILSMLVAVPVMLSGCAGGVLLNNPVLSAAVDKALAWVGLIDSVVSTLLKDPNVPPDFGQTYEKLRVQFAEVALLVSNLYAEGEKSQAATLEAIDKLQKIGSEIVALLQGVQVNARSMEHVAIPEPRFK